MSKLFSTVTEELIILVIGIGLLLIQVFMGIGSDLGRFLVSIGVIGYGVGRMNGREPRQHDKKLWYLIFIGFLVLLVNAFIGYTR